MTELEQKYFQYQILEEKGKALAQRRELFFAKLTEVQTTVAALEQIKKTKDKDIFLPLGSSVFVPGTIDKKEKLIVGLGADIAVEKDIEEIEKIIEKRKDILQQGLESVNEQLIGIENEMARLGPELQKLMPKK